MNLDDDDMEDDNVDKEDDMDNDDDIDDDDRGDIEQLIVDAPPIISRG